MAYPRGKHPNCRNGFKVGHPKYEGCGAPKGSRNSPSTEFKPGQKSQTKGQQLPPEWCANISASKKGKPAPHMAGKNCPFWKGGITPINRAIRASLESENWRRAVFIRDNFTCVSCGLIGGRLNADHIKPFSLFPELRFDLNNGRTLCDACHRATDTYGKRARYGK